MQNIFNYINLIFWLSFLLIITNITNFIKLLLYSELVWIIFYCYLLLIGSINDDINLISTSFFLLGFAGLEFSIGILIILLFKNINGNTNLLKNNYLNKFNIVNNKNLTNL